MTETTFTLLGLIVTVIGIAVTIVGGIVTALVAGDVVLWSIIGQSYLYAAPEAFFLGVTGSFVGVFIVVIGWGMYIGEIRLEKQ